MTGWAMMNAAEVSFSSRRVAVVSLGLVLAGAVMELLVLDSPAGALSLTVAGALAIINFRWLEVAVERMLQPGRPQSSRPIAVRLGLKLVLLLCGFGVLLAAPHVEPVAVAAGITAVVIAVLAEAVRWSGKGGG
jgi:ATP synthase I chain